MLIDFDLAHPRVDNAPNDFNCWNCKNFVEQGEIRVTMNLEAINSFKLIDCELCASCGMEKLSRLAAGYNYIVKDIDARIKQQPKDEWVEVELRGKRLVRPKDLQPIKIFTGCGQKCPKKDRYPGGTNREVKVQCEKVWPCKGMTYCDCLHKLYYNEREDQYVVECYYPNKVRDDEY